MPLTAATVEKKLLPRANMRAPSSVHQDPDYVLIPRVSVFKEHETVAQDGQPLKIGRDQLAAIARRCNQRVTTTGNMAAICIGHTATDPEEASRDPRPAIGRADNFQLGTLDNGEYCILADWYVLRQFVPDLKQYSVVSPELWGAKTYDQMFLDPIVLLGRDTQRIDMGLVPLPYARRRHPDGYDVTLYTAALDVQRYTAAVASSTNSFIATGQEAGNKSTKPRYAAEGQPPGKPARSLMPLADDDVKQIVAAIEQLPAFAFLTQNLPALQKLCQHDAEPAEGNVGEQPERFQKEGGQPSDKVPADKAKQILKDGEVHGQPLTDAQKGMLGAAAGKDKEKDIAVGQHERYARLFDEVNQLRSELSKTRKAAEEADNRSRQEEQRRINTERYAQLHALRRVRVFDLAKEVERTKYAKLSDTQFQEHVADIVENYREIVVDTDLPAPDQGLEAVTGVPGRSQQPERYSKDQIEAAKKYATEQANQGKYVPFAEAIRHVTKG
jgi:hypothetical protein